MEHIKQSLTNFFSRFLFLVRVEGESAWPVLVHGKRYLASGLLQPHIGDFAVFRNPQNQMQVMIKRVVGAAHGCYSMESAVSWGSSSRDFGLVQKRFILGKLISHGRKNRTSA